MAAACAFRVIGVNGSSRDGRDGIFHEPRFVERIGMDGDLDIVAIGDAQAAINGGGRRAPVFVQL